MAGQKIDRRTKYTKMVLKESLMALLKEKPISKISIKEICDGADINRCTFYAHYSDQYDLLKQIEEEIIADVNETLANYNYKEDESEAVQMMETIFEYVAQNSQSCQVLLCEQGDIAFQKQIMMIAQHQHVCAWTETQGMDTETAEYIYLFTVNGSIGIVQGWLKNGMRKSTKEMAEMVITLTNQGLSAYTRGIGKGS